MSRHILTAITVAILIAILGSYFWTRMFQSPSVVATSPESIERHEIDNRVTRAEKVTEPASSAVSRVAPTLGEQTAQHVAPPQESAQPKKRSDPELRRKERRAGIQATSVDITKELQLTAAEYERLLDLMTQHSLQDTRLGSQLGSIYTAPSPPTEAQRSQVVALLGEERAVKYQHYIETLPIRTLVQQFRVELGESNTLTDAQAHRLVEIIADQRTRYMKDLQVRYAGMLVDFSMGLWYGPIFVTSRDQGTSRREQLLTQMHEYNERLMKAARPVLSDSQLEVFQWRLQDRVADLRGRIQAMEGVIDMEEGD